jgi:hypothetical protein
VAILAINADQKQAQMLAVPHSSIKYVLSAEPLQGNGIRLNGALLELGANDALPALNGTPSPAGTITMSPATIVFIGVPDADNDACK